MATAERRLAQVDSDANVLAQQAANFMTEVYDSSSGDKFGCDIVAEGELELDGDAIDEVSLSVLAMYSLLSQAYLSGRIDQISDLRNSSLPRTVKARELGEIVTASTLISTDDEEEVCDIREYVQGAVKMFQDYRGALTPRIISIATEDPETTIELTELLVGHEVSIVFYDKNGNEKAIFDGDHYGQEERKAK